MWVAAFVLVDFKREIIEKDVVLYGNYSGIYSHGWHYFSSCGWFLLSIFSGVKRKTFIGKAKVCR